MAKSIVIRNHKFARKKLLAMLRNFLNIFYKVYIVEFFFVKLHNKNHLPVFLTALLLFLKNGLYDRLKNEK